MVFIAKQTVPYLLKHLIMWQYSIEAAKDASSIGIIGGADGPTAIYLSSHKSTYSVFGYLICWLVLLACYKPLNKRINHR
jgi:Na+-transporting methylmalonyl-CoA/oxaloacetate decarboxylase beta subunit